MRVKTIPSIVVIFLLFINCTDQIETPVNPTAVSIEYIYGSWQEIETPQFKFDFLENGILHAYNLSSNSSVLFSGPYEFLNDGQRFKLYISYTNSPFVFPIGDYRGRIIMNSADQTMITLLLNGGEVYPLAIQDADFYWVIHKIPTPNYEENL